MIVDRENLVRDFPVSSALLAQGGLMSPRLMQLFGAVHARQNDLVDASGSMVRWSTIFQTETGSPLLHAKLVIFETALPEGLLDCLLSGTRLFGDLLIEAGVAVRVTNQELFQTDLPATGAWGRRHRILDAGNDAPLCDVEEQLESEDTLQGLVLPAARKVLG